MFTLRNQFVAEYALCNVESPIGVSEYELLCQLPQTLTTELPSIEEAEVELEDSKVTGNKKTYIHHLC